MFQFSCRFAFFINFSPFKSDTDNNANFDAVSRKCANFDEVHFLIKHIPRFIIFGTHDPQAFRYNTLSNKLLLMQLFLFNFRPNLRRRKWRKYITRRTVLNFLDFTSSLLMLLFVQPLSGNFVINYQAMLPLHSYRLLIKIVPSLLNDVMLSGGVRRNFQNLRYFRCPVWKTKSC